MAGRPDPERIYQARRAALLARLTQEDRMAPELADVWVAAWEVEAADRGLERHSPAFWTDAREWILERRRRRPG
jgi:hypothetical protein